MPGLHAADAKTEGAPPEHMITLHLLTCLDACRSIVQVVVRLRSSRLLACRDAHPTAAATASACCQPQQQLLSALLAAQVCQLMLPVLCSGAAQAAQFRLNLPQQALQTSSLLGLARGCITAYRNSAPSPSSPLAVAAGQRTASARGEGEGTELETEVLGCIR